MLNVDLTAINFRKSVHIILLETETAESGITEKEEITV